MKLRNQMSLSEKEIQLSNWIKTFPLPDLTGNFNDLQPIKELSQVLSFENGFKKQSQLQIQLEVQRYQQIKMSMAPSLQVGYVNQSFNGYQNIMGTGRFFNPSNRFQSVQIGITQLAMPLSTVIKYLGFGIRWAASSTTSGVKP